MLPFLWATSSFQKIIMSFQKKPKQQRIAQSGHPGVERKGSRLVLKDFKEKK